MNNTSYKPTAFLSKYIDRFYIFKQSSDTYFELPPVLPGTGAELVFHLNDPLKLNTTPLPKTHIICPRTIAYFDKTKEASFLSVRFKSGAFRHFSSIPFSELNNAYLSIQSLWKGKGEELEKKIGNTTDSKIKISLIESFLIDVFHTYHCTKNDKWDLIIDDLYYNFDTNSIANLAQKSNLSLRQFERNFKSQFGLSAKEFQKITRFQDVIKKILLTKNSDYLNTILDNGYFDQSHFIKEFKSLTQKTPSEYFITKNFDSHFYHESINSEKPF
jgi:AraC-like DNA-binding protein